MKVEDATESDIYKLYDLCSEIYSQNGIKIKFPKHTDPTKTYQWRFLKSLYSKFIKWNLDGEMQRQFVIYAVGYAKKHKILHKGLSIFHQSNIMDLCYEDAKKSQDKFENNAKLVLRQHRWLLNQAGDKDLDNILLQKRGSTKNIVLWHQSSNLSELYISISQACLRSYKKMTNTELEMMPSLEKLCSLRSSFMINHGSKQIINVINHINSVT